MTVAVYHSPSILCIRKFSLAVGMGETSVAEEEVEVESVPLENHATRQASKSDKQNEPKTPAQLKLSKAIPYYYYNIALISHNLYLKK